MSIFGIDVPKDIQEKMDATASEDSTQSEESNAYIYKEAGGFNNFLLQYGLKIWNHDDVEEGKAIATEMRRGDEQEAREAREATNSQQRTPQQYSQLQVPRSQQNRPLPSRALPSPQLGARYELVPLAVRDGFVPLANRPVEIPEPGAASIVRGEDTRRIYGR